MHKLNYFDLGLHKGQELDCMRLARLKYLKTCKDKKSPMNDPIHIKSMIEGKKRTREKRLFNVDVSQFFGDLIIK